MDCHTMDENRRLARRKFARLSFLFLLMLASLVSAAVVFHPSRLEISQAVSNVSGLLTGITTAFVAIIMSYLGVSAWERIQTGGQIAETSSRPVQQRQERPAPPGAPFPEN